MKGGDTSGKYSRQDVSNFNLEEYLISGSTYTT